MQKLSKVIEALLTPQLPVFLNDTSTWQQLWQVSVTQT